MFGEASFSCKIVFVPGFTLNLLSILFPTTQIILLLLSITQTFSFSVIDNF